MKKEEKIRLKAEYYRGKANTYFALTAIYSAFIAITITLTLFYLKEVEKLAIIGLFLFLLASVGYFLFWKKAVDFQELEKKELEKIIGKIKE